jgi:hypothetical protein
VQRKSLSEQAAQAAVENFQGKWFLKNRKTLELVRHAISAIAARKGKRELARQVRDLFAPMDRT